MSVGLHLQKLNLLFEGGSNHTPSPSTSSLGIEALDHNLLLYAQPLLPEC